MEEHDRSTVSVTGIADTYQSMSGRNAWTVAGRHAGHLKHGPAIRFRGSSGCGA